MPSTGTCTHKVAFSCFILLILTFRLAIRIVGRGGGINDWLGSGRGSACADAASWQLLLLWMRWREPCRRRHFIDDNLGTIVGGYLYTFHRWEGTIKPALQRQLCAGVHARCKLENSPQRDWRGLGKRTIKAAGGYGPSSESLSTGASGPG